MRHWRFLTNLAVHISMDIEAHLSERNDVRNLTSENNYEHSQHLTAIKAKKILHGIDKKIDWIYVQGYPYSSNPFFKMKGLVPALMQKIDWIWFLEKTKNISDKRIKWICKQYCKEYKEIMKHGNIQIMRRSNNARKICNIKVVKYFLAQERKLSGKKMRRMNIE